MNGDLSMSEVASNLGYNLSNVMQLGQRIYADSI